MYALFDGRGLDLWRVNASCRVRRDRWIGGHAAILSQLLNDLEKSAMSGPGEIENERKFC